MADTVFSQQLDAAQAAHAQRVARKNRFVGRSWFNVMLALVLVAISLWVYRSPLTNFVDNSPIVSRTQQSLVESFNGALNDIVLDRQTTSMAATAQAQQKEAEEVTAALAQAAEDEQGAADALAADEASTEQEATPDGQTTGDSEGAVLSTTTTTTPTKTTSTTTPKPAVLTSGPAVPKMTVPSMAEIVNPSSTYFGAAMSQTPFDLAAMEPFTAAMGKRPNLVGGYQTWDNDYRPNATANAWKRGQLTMLSWEPMMATQDVKLADISAGAYDEYITRYATSIRDSGLPVALRFAHEMNGRWYPWSENELGNNPGDYVAAWQHVHNVFSSVGATNVVWVWSPNVVGSNRDLSLSQVYPGDDYVDWAALSGYYRVDTGRVPSFDRTFKESLNAVRAVSSKPILLSEIGVGTTAENRVTWLNSLFASLPANPDVIGFVYFNYDKTTQEGSLQDWRLEFDPTVQEAFRIGIADPRFGAGY